MIEKYDSTQAIQSIGMPKVEHRAVIGNGSSFQSNLRKLLSRMGNTTKQSIERATGNLRHSWKNTGIPNSIDEAASSLYGVKFDPRLLKHLAFEWTQNAVEHGAKFNGDVIVETLGGDAGILVSISDAGDGIPDLSAKIEKDIVRYSADGFPMGRGYGLQGAKDTDEVAFGFEKNESGFRVHLLVTAEQIGRVSRHQMAKLLSLN